jgi:hypothetical protein
LERSLIGSDPEAVLGFAIELAARRFADRLLAAYAIGSLAHGGFSPAVSDVDLAVVVADPERATDTATATQITERVRAEGGLADRLSLFWASPNGLTGTGTGTGISIGGAGRLPALDRLDLACNGRRLYGSFDLATIRIPTARDLVVEGAEFALDKLSAPAVIDELRDGRGLVAGGPRHLTKRILFPVRFTYTAATHEIGTNEAAVAWYVASGFPEHDLVARAGRWRDEPLDPVEAERLVGAGIVAIYDFFLATYIEALHELGELGLAADFGAWRLRLSA